MHPWELGEVPWGWLQRAIAAEQAENTPWGGHRVEWDKDGSGGGGGVDG